MFNRLTFGCNDLIIDIAKLVIIFGTFNNCLITLGHGQSQYLVTFYELRNTNIYLKDTFLSGCCYGHEH